MYQRLGPKTDSAQSVLPVETLQGTLSWFSSPKSPLTSEECRLSSRDGLSLPVFEVHSDVYKVHTHFIISCQVHFNSQGKRTEKKQKTDLWENSL